MLATVLSISLVIFAIAAVVLKMAGTGPSKRVQSRLDSFEREFEATDYRNSATDIRKAQKSLSTIPWLNHLLTQMNLGPASDMYLYQGGVTTSLGALLITSLAGSAVLGVLLYLRVSAAVPALILSLAFLPLPFLYVRRKRAKRLLKLEQQLPEALDTMVSALRVGHSLIASLGAVAEESRQPIAGEMRKCFEEQNYGLDLRTVLSNLTERVPIQDFRIFTAAVMIQKESGGNLAEVLEKVALTTRERFRLKKQVAVHTAQGRLTGWILSILPFALGLGMYFVNPEGMSVLWTRPVGLKMLYIAVGMDIVGSLIIRKIVAVRV